MIHERPAKARTLWPLPGGRGSYVSSLRTILRIVQQTTDIERVIDEIMSAYSLSSRKAARSYIRVVATLGFVEVVGQSVYLTRSGRAELADPDLARVRRALLTRVAGCREIIAVLRRRPLRIGCLRERLARVGFEWSTATQVRYRLFWLEEVGEVEHGPGGRPEYRVPERQRNGRVR